MALIDKHSTCWFCGEPIDINSDFFVAVFDFCQAPAHWNCYAAWPERGEFARNCVAEAVAAEQSSIGLHRVFLNELVFVELDSWNFLNDKLKERLANTEQVQVWLTKTGRPLRVKLNDWTRWLPNVDAL